MSLNRPVCSQHTGWQYNAAPKSCPQLWKTGAREPEQSFQGLVKDNVNSLYFLIVCKCIQWMCCKKRINVCVEAEEKEMSWSCPQIHWFTIGAFILVWQY